ncbi:MAG: LysM peptidoglycan-binding domain-containing protein [Deltaproteobacteria bacterium]|nr:LysM peptidoglycan-binding domain-containing protein [Deltaproteobacteria bacterium]
MNKGIRFFSVLIFLLVITALPGYGQETKEDVYVIKKGDTLWDVSGKYLGSPYQWPELWERNQYITNPHLIYPGNPLRLHGEPAEIRTGARKGAETVGEAAGGTATEAQSVSKPEGPAEIVEQPKESEEAVAVEEKGEISPSMEVTETGPVGETEVAQVLRKGNVEYLVLEEESLGTIVDARYEKKLLAQGDFVYLALKERPARVGERFLIFRTKKMLKNPYSKKTTKKIYVVGALRVTAVKGVLYQAEITDSMDAVLRGDEVMTYRALE